MSDTWMRWDFGDEGQIDTSMECSREDALVRLRQENERRREAREAEVWAAERRNASEPR